MNLKELVSRLRQDPALHQKRFLRELSQSWTNPVALPGGETVKLGDDAAVIPRGDTNLLLAAELILPDLVENNPEMAGRSAVLTNVNDIYAMGGRPLAIQNILLCENADHLQRIRNGLNEASRRYNVPIVGGHTTRGETSPTLGATALGEAGKPLSCFNVKPGQSLIVAVPLRGTFETHHRFWNGTDDRTDEELRGDLEILPQLAEEELCVGARDISMAGISGSLLMLLEPTGLGANIKINKIPRPDSVGEDLTPWLTAFPSYGFILSTEPDLTETVVERFENRSITARPIGTVTDDSRVRFQDNSNRRVFWDFEETSLTGFTDRTS